MLSSGRGPGLVFITMVFLAGCATHRPVEITIPTRFFASDGAPTEELIIFLPGRGDDIGAFERAGFIDILQQSNHVADSVVMDAHMGYYMDASLPERINQEILLPYQQQGYRRFIIVGVSIGGYGALWTSHEHYDLVSAVVLLAPYLGKEPLIENIESSGSINTWRSELGHEPNRDEKVWVWIDDMGNAGGGEIETAIIAIGRNDRFSRAAELFSTAIPDSHMFRNNGNHNWKTWKALWLEVTKSQSWEFLGYTE